MSTGVLQLEQTCDTSLMCKCGSENFRIHMDCDEDSDALSETTINNVECAKCHALFRLRYVTGEPHP